VTNPEQIPVDAFLGDRQFARQEMIDVLERAGSVSPTRCSTRGARAGEGPAAFAADDALAAHWP
jgi:hypothetical protein